MKLIFVLACACLLFACSKGNEQTTEYSWEINADDATPFISGNVEGINFKFCLLNEKGSPFTELLTGKNFSFYFELANHRKSDSLTIDGGLLGALYDEGFCGIRFPNQTAATFPFNKPECSADLYHLYGNNNRYAVTIPWRDSLDRRTVEACSVESLHNSLLPKGMYSAEFTHTFAFSGINQQQAPLSIGPLTFRINFEVRDTISVPVKSYFPSADTSCHWSGIILDDVMLIDSTQQLEQFLFCSKGSYNTVDLTKNTLLLTGISATAEVNKIESKLYQTSDTEYILKLNIHLNDNDISGNWAVSVTTPKLPEGSSVKLVTDYIKPQK